ncbi:MAG: class I SAM-dependent RNA methyltransferase, partial [Planctomycetaceae bacterium]
MSTLRFWAVVRWTTFSVVAGVVATVGPTAWGQFGGFGFRGAVGGISVDADGIVRTLEPRALESLAAERTQALAAGGWSGT